MPAWFEYILNTPSHHRVHHGVNPKYIDRNHGGTFIIYDRIFGTFQEEEEEVHYGITSQLKSWNVGVANFDYYGWIGKQLVHVKTAKDFLLILFKAPGWRPVYLGGPIVPKEIDTTRQLYDEDTTSKMHVYLVIQFGLFLAFVSFFLFGIEKFDLTQKLIAIGFIILSSVTIGSLFERKKWAAVLEAIRLLLVIPVLYFLIM